MTDCITTYLERERHYDVLDFGSFINAGQTPSHRQLLVDYDVTIVGVDIQEGRNVDVVMKQPYRIPVASASQDVVLSGQVFEHLPFPWATMLEVARVLRPGGHFFLTVPSRGHHHSTYDCWRYYPDSMRALAAWADLTLLEAYTDFPPMLANKRHDYRRIDTKDHYWGDTTGVFRKPASEFSPRKALTREVVLRRANQIGDLRSVPRPKRTQLHATSPASPQQPATVPATSRFPQDFDEDIRKIIEAVTPWTMTGIEKLHALISATRYISEHQVPGAVVECGVWRGGSMHAVARTLAMAGDTSRELYLFDTFEGMPAPTEEDRRYDGADAATLLEASSSGGLVRAYATLEDVQDGFRQVPYPSERLHIVPGLVEDTIPQGAPEQIAILRLDTDWYASTKHELEHLYDRLVSGGVLILDDYGWWQGAQQATDEWLAKTGVKLLLLRAGSGRIAIKP